MALAPATRAQLLARLINKAHAGQLDGDKFLGDLVAALGVSFDAALKAEAAVLVNELNAAKASADAQSLDLANQITTFQAV